MESIDAEAYKTLVADVAVMMNEMKNMRESLNRIEQNLRDDRSNFVTRAEWDTKRISLDREIKEIKEKDKSKTAVWTSVAAVVIAGISALASFVKALT